MENFDINALDIKTLRLLLAIADQGSVTRAADARAMTQSTASYGLDKLRAAFGDPLFVRAGRGVVVTERGRQIVEGCRTVLDALDEMAAGAAFDPGTARRDFIITTAAYEVEAILVPLRRVLSAAAPRARMVVRGLDLRRVTEHLEADVDLALLAAPVGSAVLKRRLLFEDRFVTFYDAAARSAPRTLKQFCDAPHAMATLGGAAISDIDDALAARGRKRRVALAVNNLESLPSMMRGSDLIATLPRRMDETLMRDFAHTPCPVDLDPIAIHALWHARKDTDRGHRWLRERIYEAVRGKR